MFFTGEEALREVAKLDGQWNWALVGPDPVKLPLAGGGPGSVEEMRNSIGKHAHSYGLLRMTFGVEAATTKLIFIHASDPIDSGNFSAAERGRALSVEPEMDKALRRFVAFSAKVTIHTPEDCTAEALVQKLQESKQGVSGKMLTVENFKIALEHHKEQYPWVLGDDERLKLEAELLREGLAGGHRIRGTPSTSLTPSAVAPPPPPPPPAAQSEPSPESSSSRVAMSRTCMG